MFDALKYTKRLERCGFTKEQAEEALIIGIEVMNENLATKQDIKDSQRDMQEINQELKRNMGELRQEVKRDMGELRQEVKRDIEELRQEVKRDIEELRQQMLIGFKSINERFELYATKEDLAALQDRLTIRMGAMFAATIAILGSLKFI